MQVYHFSERSCDYFFVNEKAFQFDEWFDQSMKTSPNIIIIASARFRLLPLIYKGIDLQSRKGGQPIWGEIVNFQKSNLPISQNTKKSTDQKAKLPLKVNSPELSINQSLFCLSMGWHFGGWPFLLVSYLPREKC